jgi:hypothetical protein
MGDLFDDDPNAAKKARDAALARVRQNGGDWREKALCALYLIPGFEGTAEDIRLKLQIKRLEPPHHHNAWGEMIKAALAQKMIIPTGQRRKMRTRKSHARETAVYRVIVEG